MDKNTKIIISMILIILCIAICYFIFGKNKEKDEKYLNNEIVSNTLKAEEIENTANVENVLNEVNSSVITNEVEEEIVVENITEVKEQGTVYESSTDTGTTDRKQEAIALVKEKWGEDSTVTFRCDSVSNNGEYIIAVVSKDTASVKNYFKVDLVTKTVEVDY